MPLFTLRWHNSNSCNIQSLKCLLCCFLDKHIFHHQLSSIFTKLHDRVNLGSVLISLIRMHVETLSYCHLAHADHPDCLASRFVWSRLVSVNNCLPSRWLKCLRLLTSSLTATLASQQPNVHINPRKATNRSDCRVSWKCAVQGKVVADYK